MASYAAATAASTSNDESDNPMPRDGLTTSYSGRQHVSIHPAIFDEQLIAEQLGDLSLKSVQQTKQQLQEQLQSDLQCARSSSGDCDATENVGEIDTCAVAQSVVDSLPAAADQQYATTVYRTVQIGPQHFDLLHLLGEGAFGKVLLVRQRLDKELYAMKVLSKKLLKKKNNVKYMKSERDILTKVFNPFIVQLHYAFQSETKLFLVMDFLAGGELFFHLRKKGIILEREARFYLAEMVLAVEFLHLNGIVHRDLKPENILLRADGHVSLTDFGLAKEIGDGVLTRTLCGTSEYMAPEMLTRNGYGSAVDWWSLGAIFFEMLAGKPPFQAKSQKDLDRKILSEKFSAPTYLAAATHALLKGFLEKDPNKRLGCTKSTMFKIGGVAALKSHAFFEHVDWSAVERLETTPPFDFTAPNGEAENGSIGADKHYHMQFFDAEFTTQPISPSVLDDTYSTGATTPKKSATSSRLEGNSHFAGDEFGDDQYTDFEFMNRPAEYTEQQLDEFEEMMRVRIQKANKKKALRLKKEEKAAAEEAIRKVEAERAAEEALKAKAEAKAAADAAAERKRATDSARAQRKAAQEAHDRRYQQYIEDLRRCREHNAKVQSYNEKLSKCQKRIKALKKKLRDIDELQQRVQSDCDFKPSAEQREKLKRRDELQRELEECEDHETEIIESSPGDSVIEPTAVPEQLPSADHDGIANGKGVVSVSRSLPSAERSAGESLAPCIKPPTKGIASAEKQAVTSTAAVSLSESGAHAKGAGEVWQTTGTKKKKKKK